MSRQDLLIGVVSAALIVSSVVACEIRVRDAAFRTPRDRHRLCVIAGANDASADAIHSRLLEWHASLDGQLNVEVVRVDADDPETNWHFLGLPSAPPVLPVTVLIGRNNGSGDGFVIAHWEPEPDDDALRALFESPVRNELARELTRSVAVLLYAPRDPDGASQMLSRIEAIASAGAEERIGLSVITLDRTDERERMLCAFMGLRPDAPDTLVVAFGRGKLMQPPLVGDEIDDAHVKTLVTQIRQACSCSKPLPTMGVDVPLAWTDELDSSVVLMDTELDLDDVEEELQATSLAGFTDDPATDDSVEAAADGDSADGSGAAHSTASTPATTQHDKSTGASWQPTTTAAVAVAGMVLIVLASSFVVMLRGRSE